MGDTALAIREAEPLAAWNPRQVVAQVKLVQDIMKEIMKPGEHYGIIPGTERKDKDGKDISKPALLQPGAQTLCLTFRLAAEYVVEERDLGGGHIDVKTKTTLRSITTGAIVGSGVGSCSTMESKYRYRDSKRKCPVCGQEAIIKGKAEYGGGWLCFKKQSGCGAKFNDGDQSIESQKVGRVENPDLADTWNTVRKMSKKRSYVDATITTLGVSDMFTQDVEDFAPVVAPAVPESPAVHPTVIDVEPTPTPEPVFILVDWEQDLANAPTIAALKDLWARAQRSPEWAQCTKAMHDRWERVKDDRKAALA